MRPHLPNRFLLALALLIAACATLPRSSVEGARAGECEDAIDNDGDGQVDCQDSDCAGAPVCAPTGDDDDSTPPCDSDQELEIVCDDGCDNDNNGLTDCEDLVGCLADPACDGPPQNDDDDSAWGEPQSGPCFDMPCCCEPDIATGKPTCTSCLEQMGPPPIGCGDDPSGWTPTGHLLEEGSTVCCGFGVPPSCEECSDGLDNDQDGLIDELDDGCYDWFSSQAGSQPSP